MRAVVTGAGRGLGARIAASLRSAGYEVTATDVEGAEVYLDVTDSSACRDLARQIDPHVWVNNAAVLGAGDAATQPQEEVERLIAVNLLGTINGTRAAVEVMRRHDGGRGRGHIISVGSLASWVPVPGETVYAATKAALLSYTLGLRAELRAQGVAGVHFSVVCPDGMLTPMIVEQLHNPAVALSFSGPRTIEPEQVADRVVALLRRPRLVSSVPHWRGAMVRVLGAVPDHALGLSRVFTAAGDAKRRKAAAGSPHRRARNG